MRPCWNGYTKCAFYVHNIDLKQKSERKKETPQLVSVVCMKTENDGGYVMQVLPQGIAGVFFLVLLLSHYHVPQMLTCKLVLYTAVTEQSWWRPCWDFFHPRGHHHSTSSQFIVVPPRNLHFAPSLSIIFPLFCWLHHQAFSSASQSGSDQQ